MKTIRVTDLPNCGASKLLSKAFPVLAATVLMAWPAEARTLVWATSYSGISGSALEEVEGVVADGAGNLFVTGLSGAKGIGSAIRVMKLDAKGSIVWKFIHSQPALCGGMWGRTPIALDSAGNLIVVGAEFTSGMDNWNPVVLRLNPGSGTVLSRWAFNLGPFASFDAVAVAGADIYVLAHNNPNDGNPHIVHTLKLGSTGAILWSDSFTPGTFCGTRGGIAVTAAGLYTAAGGRVTAHDFNGGFLWQHDLVMPHGGSALAPDSAGNVYLVAQNGVVNFHPNGGFFGVIGSLSSKVSDLDVDSAGNLYLVGSRVRTASRGSDIITQKYNPSGRLLWSTTYGKHRGNSDDGIAISVRGGYVYVGGSKYNKDFDMCALKYTAGN
jgi:hypothetical protein